ncbi:hypothetical protein NLX86_12660 [Streptomyces sp. A3M-1-3]|uniref:hypothetical protein n=1 Tax=Streptomyces sp. A3M-1-3 TaxID=2962044 RepID=UPI0020B8A044|nr:hypothetical protein [Streptomyces sp. A3M-1-3]MCP3818932.1 hypothetical protein [Streptomyces sp. A3M-1-3]
MADERYKWLDRRAAERLLRGEPVESADDQVREEAGRLSAALDRAARVPDSGAAGLPGEEAALAAFRTAQGARSRAPLGEDTPLAVRLTSAPGSPARAGRPVRWGRPLNFGLAAALAGCALGSVAVAAGTGVLPTPFGDRARPQPAVSVSIAGTPDALTSPAPGTGAPSDPPPSSGDPSIAGGATEGPGTSSGSPEPSDGAGNSSRHPGDGTAREDARERNRTWLLQACRDYRSGRGLAEDRKQRLEEGAGGAHRVERFCKRLLGVGDGGNAGDDGEKNGDRGSGGADDGGDDDGDDAGTTSGNRDTGMPPAAPVPMPPLDFVPVTPAGVTLFERVTQD